MRSRRWYLNNTPTLAYEDRSQKGAQVAKHDGGGSFDLDSTKIDNLVSAQVGWDLENNWDKRN